MLGRYLDDSEVVKWCGEVVADDGSERDGRQWRHWKGQHGLINRLAGFLKNVTKPELLSIGLAAAQYDGDGRTDVPTSAGQLRTYMVRLSSKDPKVVLMGPGN